MPKTRILIVGDMTVGTNSRSLADGFRATRHEVATLNTALFIQDGFGQPDWFVQHVLKRPRISVSKKLEHALVSMISSFRPQILIVIKGVRFDQEVFLSSNVPSKVHVSFDDVGNTANVSNAYLENEHRWDFICTTKFHNIAELYSRGAKNVIFFLGAFDPNFAVKDLAWNQRRYALAFIGNARPDRRALPEYMAAIAFGEAYCVGPRWERYYPFGLAGVEFQQGMYGPHLRGFGRQVKIGLLVLNSENRDTHTMRSFELPSLGQAVVAQRTSEHEALFTDGHSAMLFDSFEEMVSKATFLKNHDRIAEKLASNAFNDLARPFHTYRARAEEILAKMGIA